MSVRRATPDDAPTIAAVEAAAAHAPWTEPQVRVQLVSPTTRAWVVGEPPVGHLLASSVADEGEILTLAVHPDARRHGHARALLRACAQAWADEGVRHGWLEVRVDNTGARALYTAAGWVESGRRPRYYADGTDAVHRGWFCSWINHAAPPTTASPNTTAKKIFQNDQGRAPWTSPVTALTATW